MSISVVLMSAGLLILQYFCTMFFINALAPVTKSSTTSFFSVLSQLRLYTY
jgi:hypothetical protein